MEMVYLLILISMKRHSLSSQQISILFKNMYVSDTADFSTKELMEIKITDLMSIKHMQACKGPKPFSPQIFHKKNFKKSQYLNSMTGSEHRLLDQLIFSDFINF